MGVTNHLLTGMILQVPVVSIAGYNSLAHRSGDRRTFPKLSRRLTDNTSYGTGNNAAFQGFLWRSRNSRNSSVVTCRPTCYMQSTVGANRGMCMPSFLGSKVSALQRQSLSPCRIGTYGNFFAIHAVNKIFYKMIDEALVRNPYRHIDYIRLASIALELCKGALRYLYKLKLAGLLIKGSPSQGFSHHFPYEKTYSTIRTPFTSGGMTRLDV